jgi:hypothetical protein
VVELQTQVDQSTILEQSMARECISQSAVVPAYLKAISTELDINAEIYRMPRRPSPDKKQSGFMQVMSQASLN